MASLDNTTNSLPVAGSTEDEVQVYSPLGTIAVSFATVLLGAIGDKTFFIAAFMSMRYNRAMVLIGSSAALFIILGLSAALGSYVVGLVSEKVAKAIMVVLFFGIGARLIYEFFKYKGEEEEGEKHEAAVELKKLEDKLQKQFHPHDIQTDIVFNQEVQNNQVEEPFIEGPSFQNDMTRQAIKPAEEDENIIGPPKLFALFQSFSLIFFGEWGDRSQLYTMALSSRNPPILVFIGAFTAHFIAIVAAVIFGKYISTKINEKWLILGAGVLYIIFGFLALLS